MSLRVWKCLILLIPEPVVAQQCNNKPEKLVILFCLRPGNLAFLRWYVFAKILSTSHLSWPCGKSVIVGFVYEVPLYVRVLCKLLEPLRLYITILSRVSGITIRCQCRHICFLLLTGAGGSLDQDQYVCTEGQFRVWKVGNISWQKAIQSV